MLYCCGCYYSRNEDGENRKINLLDNLKYKNRVMEIGICPKCGTLKAYIRQYRIVDDKYIEQKPKNTRPQTVFDFIRKYEKEPYLEFENKCPKNGTKTNMYWYWWNGAIDFWVRDDNGTKQFELDNTCKIIV